MPDLYYGRVTYDPPASTMKNRSSAVVASSIIVGDYVSFDELGVRMTGRVTQNWRGYGAQVEVVMADGTTKIMRVRPDSIKKIELLEAMAIASAAR